jgi:L-amino acid N-acyltransferase YncA
MIRPVTYSDIDSVVEIYNQAIDARFQTAYMERLSVADRAGWFQEHVDTAYPMFVYEVNGRVAGWFCIASYRGGRAALRYTVEISYFIDKDHQHQGIGSQLVLHGINACRQLGYKTAIAIIIDRNTGSRKLMEKYGFEQWAYLPGVAEYDGEECDQVYYGLRL